MFTVIQKNILENGIIVKQVICKDETTKKVILDHLVSNVNDEKIKEDKQLTKISKKITHEKMEQQNYQD